jgi:hypothetical protein
MISNLSFMQFLLVCVNNNNKPELCACFCCYVLYAVGKLALLAGCTASSGELWGQVVVSWKVLH